MKAKLIMALAVLFAAVMTASACNVCPTNIGLKPDEIISGGYWDAGTTKTFTAPAASTYQWYRVVEGVGTTDLGTANPMSHTLTIASNAWCGKEVAIYVTATNEFGCKWMRCIWYTIRCITCPDLNDFCIGVASDADANEFKPTLPAGVTGTWVINPGGVNIATTETTAAIKAKLNALTPAGAYTATLTLSSGQVCTDTFNVRPAPTGNLVVT